MPMIEPSAAQPRPSSPPRVLISGGGVAGTATAFWLARAGVDVTVLERSSAPRQAGQNVDVRGLAREVVRRMGLEEAVRGAGTGELGTRFVDERGRILAQFPVSHDGDGRRGPTAELEILRSTLVELLRDTVPSSVSWRYGSSIEAVHDTGKAVEVTLRDGGRETADALVIAEGVGSPTRDRLMPHGVEQKRLDLAMAFATVPRRPGDDRWWNWCITSRGRSVSLRPDPVGTTRALLSWRTGPLGRLAADDTRALLRERFAGVGWEAPRILDALDDAADLYLDDLRQIHCQTWSKGRTCLVGDAAWCATPISGAGTSLALTGSYVLGTMLGADLAAGRDPRGAFAAFEAWMRPEVEDAQTLAPGAPGTAHPRTRAGLAALRTALRVAGSRSARRAAALLPSGSDRRRRRQLPPLPVAAPAS